MQLCIRCIYLETRHLLNKSKEEYKTRQEKIKKKEKNVDLNPENLAKEERAREEKGKDRLIIYGKE